MKINRYINFITEEAPYNLDASADIISNLKKNTNLWTPSEKSDLKRLGADKITKNNAVFNQGDFIVNIKKTIVKQKNGDKIIYIAISNKEFVSKINIYSNISKTTSINRKEIDNKPITFDYIWQNFLIKLDKFVRTGDFLPEDLCNYLGINNYSINDGYIDVDGDVNLRNMGLNKIPLKFGNVSGWFDCSCNNLTNLIGSPRRVEKNFDCGGNSFLTSLEGCPEYIRGTFWCMNNPNLWSFDYFPRHAKGVDLFRTPIKPIFDLFKSEYLADGGKFFTTSWSLMDFFWDMDPIYPGKIIMKKRMEMFLSSIDKKLTQLGFLRGEGWKIK